jgi:hypothetical protein
MTPQGDDPEHTQIARQRLCHKLGKLMRIRDFDLETAIWDSVAGSYV